MNNIHKKALALRLEGYSYTEINRSLGVAKSTLSSWFHDMPLSEVAQKRIRTRVSDAVLKGLVKRNKDQTIIAQERARSIRTKSKERIRQLSLNDVMLIGVALYWAEGHKRLKFINGIERTHHSISLTNSDPGIINAFILFLERVMNVNRDEMYANLRLYPHMVTDDAIHYWSETTGISKSNFDQPSYVVSSASKGKRPYNRLPYGTMQVRVANTNKFHDLMGKIDGLKEVLARFQQKT